MSRLYYTIISSIKCTFIYHTSLYIYNNILYIYILYRCITNIYIFFVLSYPVHPHTSYTTNYYYIVVFSFTYRFVDLLETNTAIHLNITCVWSTQQPKLYTCGINRHADGNILDNQPVPNPIYVPKVCIFI